MVYCSHPLCAFLWELGWILNEYFLKQIYWCCDVYIYVVLMRKKAAPHNNRIHFVLFVCVLCTMWCFVWFLHEMVLLLHENLNYCTKRIWYLCKLQNKNFSMVCCITVVRWRWEREGVKDGCYNLLLAAAASPWSDRSAIGYLKWDHLRSWPTFSGTGSN